MNVYDKAADLLEEHGWCRNHNRDLDGRMCMVGAIAMAATGDPNGMNPGIYDLIYSQWAMPFRFNDVDAADGAEVVAALREAAKA